MIKANVPRVVQYISSHTRAQLVICLVDDMLLQARPCSSRALLQISDGSAVDTLLVMPQDFIVNWIRTE